MLKKLFILTISLLLLFSFTYGLSKAELNKRLEKSEAKYKKQLSSMEGSIPAFIKLFDYMGKGYVKVNLDFIIQINNFEEIKSDKFTVTVKSDPTETFTIDKKYNLKRDDFAVTSEGNGITILTLKVLPNTYENITVNINGNNNKETASYQHEKFVTIKLNNKKFKISDVLMVKSVNKIKDKRFFRRKYFLVPTIDYFYKKNKKVGFYFEFYHLKVSALEKIGKYSVDYKIVFDALDKVVYKNSKTKDDANENGFFIEFMNMQDLFTGVYRLEITFKDENSGQSFDKTKYFRIYNKDKKLK